MIRWFRKWSPWIILFIMLAYWSAKVNYPQIYIPGFR